MNALFSIVDDSSNDELLFNLMQSYAEKLEREVNEGPSERPPREPRMYINRNREDAAQRLWDDYFDEDSRFPPHKFGLSRMRTHWSQGFDVIQKCTSTLHQLAYGTTAYVFDYLQMSEKTLVVFLDNFCFCVTNLYKSLRKPTVLDVERLYATREEMHGFRGCLEASNACTGNGRVVQLHGKVNTRVVIKRTWSSYLKLLLRMICGRIFQYLQDSLIKAFSSSTDEPRAKFKRFQESARKDVERTFGVLQEDNSFAICTLHEELLSKLENHTTSLRNRNSDRATRGREISDEDCNPLGADDDGVNLMMQGKRAIITCFHAHKDPLTK
ncbi:uncharacterized protein [Rutidosis leptorrhynchoides]|uniref:uncharacterized protein n=1 Tax=Rutidosis leptorrhynchoides TaxID=125765 RepID=UPI003A9953A0